jgi:hypothetical protein
LRYHTNSNIHAALGLEKGRRERASIRHIEKLKLVMACHFKK